MKRFVVAIALACALSGTALAGEIHSTGAATAPPLPENTQATLAGNIPSTDYGPPVVENSLLTVLLTIIGAL